MAFESLSFRYTFTIPNFPQRWIPLIHLYDPDLPLFPICYFHVLPDNLTPGHRPTDTERAFGYIEKLNVGLDGNAEVIIVTNKDLTLPVNNAYIQPVSNAVQERLGLLNPVQKTDVTGVFSGPLVHANAIIEEIWERVVANAYGNKLPFGKLWDEVLGLARWVASWNSQNGRKGELIQTHYFASKFGVRIPSSGGIPAVDFYLLPTFEELTDIHNPNTSFTEFAKLIRIADIITTHHCSSVTVGGINLSKFNNVGTGNFNTAGILNLINGTTIPSNLRAAATEVYNAFNKGPQRTVIFFMMIDDLRKGRITPSTLTTAQLGSLNDGLSGTFQSPKSISIYAQQSFGNSSAVPLDTWIKTFFKWPLKIHPTSARPRRVYHNILSHSRNLGKVERLLWVAAQARKVHSSVCNDALWCTKYSTNKVPRGANPLACNICLDSIRDVCPAYNAIKHELVCFNSVPSIEKFRIDTNGSKFVSCEGTSIYTEISDGFSPADNPNGFAAYPDPTHIGGSSITVEDFIRIY